jgi:two-component system sensor histidine kinase QseC
VLRSVLTPMVFALPLLALALWWAVRQGVSPMRALGHALARRRPQALEPVALHACPTEMTPMLEALNGLLQRIAELMASERRFTADAAHELRTPIAAIRVQAQVALASADDVERMQALHNTLQGCDRATRLGEQLLSLSRLEAGSAVAPGTLDLSAAAREMVADLAPSALAKCQTIEVQAAEGCSVDAEAALLSVLIRNLVDNAIRYSPVDARVKVSTRCEPGGSVLTVEDSGPGMTPVDIERLGDRFFRVAGTGQSGSGLGWSIVRRIAAVTGVQAHVSRSAELGGLVVTIRFPRSAPSGTATHEATFH